MLNKLFNSTIFNLPNNPYRVRKIDLNKATTYVGEQVNVKFDDNDFDYLKSDLNGVDIRFFDGNGTELTFFKAVHSLQVLRSDFWIRTNLVGTQTLYMTYGDPAISTTPTNEAATFIDNVLLDRYVCFTNDPAINLRFFSYTDANQVQVETQGGTQVFNLDAGESILTTCTESVIKSTGPIMGRKESGSHHDVIMPLSFATTQCGYFDSRYTTDALYFYNPNDVSVDANCFFFSSSGGSSGSSVVTVGAKSFNSLVGTDFDNSVIVESLKPLVVMCKDSSGGNDVLPLVKASTEIIGIGSNGAEVGAFTNGTTGSAVEFGGTNTSINLNRGQRQDPQPNNGSQGTAPSVLITTNFPVVGNQQADSDGTESTSFYPVDMLSSEYIIPNTAQYVTMASPYPSCIVSEFDPSGNFVTTYSAGGNPGKAIKTTSSSPGTKFVGTSAFYMYYEYATSDETNSIGPLHSRRYIEDYAPVVGTIGEQLELRSGGIEFVFNLLSGLNLTDTRPTGVSTTLDAYSQANLVLVTTVTFPSTLDTSATIFESGATGIGTHLRIDGTVLSIFCGNDDTTYNVYDLTNLNPSLENTTFTIVVEYALSEDVIRLFAKETSNKFDLFFASDLVNTTPFTQSDICGTDDTGVGVTSAAPRGGGGGNFSGSFVDTPLEVYAGQLTNKLS